MTSYRKIKKQAIMKGFIELRQFNIAMSKICITAKKFPHVKYTKQLIKDDKRSIEK